MRLPSPCLCALAAAAAACGDSASGPPTEPPGSCAADDAIRVSCSAPRFARVNTPATVSCTVDNGGRATTTPKTSTDPSTAVVLTLGATSGDFTFAFNTQLPGYSHPVDFADTVYHVGFEVKDSADGTRCGHGRADITVLGNYWIGDGSSTGSAFGGGGGISAFTSDGAWLSQVVGLAGIRGVYDIRQLPDGNLVVTSSADKLIKVFDRRGNPEAGAAFPDTDPNDSVKLWEGSTYPSPAPRQMALVGTNELWVAGAAKGSVPGIAIFHWRTHGFIAFVPHPDTNNSFQFTSLGLRPEGTMLASASNHRTICRFRTSDRQPVGPCVAVGETFCNGWSSFLTMSDGRLIGAQDGDRTSTGCNLAEINSSLATTLVKAMSYGLEVRGLVEAGDEIVGPNNSTQYVAENWLLRASATTLEELPVVDFGNRLWIASGIARLTSSTAP